MTGNDDEDAVDEYAATQEVDEIRHRLDKIEESVIAERDDAGVPGRVSERENVEQVEPDSQAPS